MLYNILLQPMVLGLPPLSEASGLPLSEEPFEDVLGLPPDSSSIDIL